MSFFSSPCPHPATHRCPAPGCRWTIADAEPFCMDHWLSLPVALRNRILNTAHWLNPQPQADALREALAHLARLAEARQPAPAQQKEFAL